MSKVWIDDTGPRLLAALPCEDAAASVALDDGRATIQRIYYELYAARFPARFGRLNIATIWMGLPAGEAGGEAKYTIGVRLSDPAGEVLVEASMAYEAQPEPATGVRLFHLGGPPTAEGLPTSLRLPRPGRYDVDVLLEGVPVSTFPLFVIGPEPEESDGTG